MDDEIAPAPPVPDEARTLFEQREWLLLEPSDAGTKHADPFFTPTLMAARMQFEEMRGLKRPSGQAFEPVPLFRESGRPNGRAIETDRYHLCVMYTALVSACFEIAGFAFVQESMFPELGDPSLEESPQIDASSLLGFSIEADLIAQNLEPAAPIGTHFLAVDPERRALSQFLWQLMLRFTWFHELFHGQRGHSGFLKAHAPELELHEMAELAVMVDDDSIAGVSYDRALHAFEIEADHAAALMLIEKQIGADEPFIAFLERSLPTRLRLAYLACVLMTVLFDHAAARYALTQNRSHPIADMRRSNVIRTIAHLAAKHGGAAQEAFHLLIGDLDSLSGVLPTMPSGQRVLADLRSAEVNAALNALEADDRTLAGALMPFAYR